MASRRSGRQPVKVSCNAAGCDSEGTRSLPRRKVESNVDFVLEGEGKKVNLCKEHYRKFKKVTKDDRKLESLGR